MSSVASIALSGMNAAQTQLRSAAHNIANAGTEGFRRERTVTSTAANGGVQTTTTPRAEADPEGAAPVEDLVGLLQAKNAFLANLAVFKTGDQMAGALLDTTG